MHLSRRSLLKILGASSASIIVSTGLQGCLLDTDSPVKVNFDHGVASGDPLADSVIIWTRVTPEESGNIKVGWQVSTDPDFTNLVNEDYKTINEDTDFTVKVDVKGLSTGTKYYYRFISNGVSSEVGETRTLADQSASEIKMAVFSCANFPAGFFHAYGAAAQRDDLDVVIHLGDYIYEYEKEGYPAAGSGEAIGRVHDPVTECIQLADYRLRYAQYRKDSDLQALHAKVPFICVWDDHEIANDAYIDGAENHQESEGEFESRQEAAIQAWYEWLPVRSPEVEADKIKTYRHFEFGSIASLMMLDTRIIGRDKQLDYANYFLAEGFDVAGFQADMTDTSRSLLGNDQLTWLQGQLQTSVASGTRWQVLGQQVLMGGMQLPISIILPDPQTGLPDPQNLVNYQTVAIAFQSLATAVVTDMTVQGDLNVYAAGIDGFESLSESDQAIALTFALQATDEARYNQIFASLAQIEQEALINYGGLLDASTNPSVPYNLDAWDGYAVEREVVFGTAKSLNANLVVLAGDTHNAWANELKDHNDDAIGVEFATSSVSSPGMEKYLSVPIGGEPSFEAGIVQLIPELKYMNISQRGYMLVTFTQQEAQSEWFFMAREAEKSSDTPLLSSLKSLKVDAGTAELKDL